MHLHSRDSARAVVIRLSTVKSADLCNKAIPGGVVSFALSHEPPKGQEVFHEIHAKALARSACIRRRRYGGESASSCTAATETQHPLHHGRRHIHHRGLMVGETPNIDRIGNEGAIFMDYVAMQSCTSGRNAFFTGMYPVRTGMIPPQLPGSPSYLRPGTPAVAKFLLDLGYNTGEF